MGMWRLRNTSFSERASATRPQEILIMEYGANAIGLVKKFIQIFPMMLWMLWERHCRKTLMNFMANPILHLLIFQFYKKSLGSRVDNSF